MSTPAGAPPDPGDGFYSHISCCAGEICLVSCPLNIRIPITGLGLVLSGLDLNLMGVVWIWYNRT